MIHIQPNSFAAACYDDNTIAELQEALSEPADSIDCHAWGITPEEWYEQIKLALAALLEDKDFNYGE